MSAPTGSPLDGDYAFCESQVKAADRARWLAGLFAPAALRPHLYALDAFALDVAQVRGKVREPLAGELRLQWWTDAIEGEARGDVRGHPVAAALLDTLRRRSIGRALLTGCLDRLRVDLYDDPISDVAAFDERADAIEGAMILARAQGLGATKSAALVEAAHQAGRALAVVKSLRALGAPVTPMHVTVPLDLLRRENVGTAEIQVHRATPPVLAALALFAQHGLASLDALRRQRRSVEATAVPALLTASLAAPFLQQVAREKTDPFQPSVDLPQWRQQWRMWRAAGRNGVL